MRRVLLVAALFGMTMGVNLGCDKNKADDMNDNEPMKMSADACAMCPGVQQAAADGTCAKCGMKVKG